MYRELTIGERLKDLRLERGLRLEDAEAQIGISKSSLSKYESENSGDIASHSLIELAKFYHVSVDFILGFTENKNHPNTALNELHLSDAAIDVLKVGKLNTRLLSEMIAHEDFMRLLVDAEIYVDRIVSMRINDYNALLKVTREQIISEHDPDKDDLYLRTLEVGQVPEDEYFGRLLSDDLTAVLNDIREAHRTDKTTADASGSEQVKQSIEELRGFDGSDAEKRIRFFCNILCIDYDKLTPEEFANLIAILKKADLNKLRKMQRGRGLYSLPRKGKKSHR